MRGSLKKPRTGCGRSNGLTGQSYVHGRGRVERVVLTTRSAPVVERRVRPEAHEGVRGAACVEGAAVAARAATVAASATRTVARKAAPRLRVCSVVAMAPPSDRSATSGPRRANGGLTATPERGERPASSAVPDA